MTSEHWNSYLLEFISETWLQMAKGNSEDKDDRDKEKWDNEDLATVNVSFLNIKLPSFFIFTFKHWTFLFPLRPHIFFLKCIKTKIVMFVLFFFVCMFFVLFCFGVFFFGACFFFFLVHVLFLSIPICLYIYIEDRNPQGWV